MPDSNGLLIRVLRTRLQKCVEFDSSKHEVHGIGHPGRYGSPGHQMIFAVNNWSSTFSDTQYDPAHRPI